MLLPKGIFRSAKLVVIEYALLLALLVNLMVTKRLGPGAVLAVWVAVLLGHIVLGPWISDALLRGCYKARPLPTDRLPTHIRNLIASLADKADVPFPRFAVIDDTRAAAIAYGHIPWNLRIVVTRGVFDLVQTAESERIVRREFDRGKQRDVSLTTMAQLLPLIYNSLAYLFSQDGRPAPPSRLTGLVEPLPAIDAYFPGGNALVERIEGDHVYLRQDQRDTADPWFYWCFRVRQAAGRTLVFHFTAEPVVGVRGPAVSTDGGASWQWLGGARTFRYAFEADADEVRFCVGVPYLQADLQRFLVRHGDGPHMRAETLATTRKQREVERLHVGRIDGAAAHRVLLSSRHHACEMMAGWVLQGILEAALAEGDVGRWLREHVELLAVPFVDKDGVEEGDQGKKRSPHDHNRDYLDDSAYPEVAALKEYVPAWSDGRLRLAIDLHCPNLLGGGDEPGSSQRIHFVGNPSKESERNLLAFCEILQRTQTGPLVFHRRHNLLWGQSWNTLEKPITCSRWADDLPGVLFATVLEVPYADVAGEGVTAETARRFGHDVARALRGFLDELSGV